MWLSRDYAAAPAPLLCDTFESAWPAPVPGRNFERANTTRHTVGQFLGEPASYNLDCRVQLQHRSLTPTLPRPRTLLKQAAWRACRDLASARSAARDEWLARYGGDVAAMRVGSLPADGGAALGAPGSPFVPQLLFFADLTRWEAGPETASPFHLP